MVSFGLSIDAISRGTSLNAWAKKHVIPSDDLSVQPSRDEVVVLLIELHNQPTSRAHFAPTLHRLQLLLGDGC